MRVLIPDSGWCDPGDLWGIGIEGCPLTVISGNPRVLGPKDAKDILGSYGLILSTNPKTIICVNTLQEYSCRMSKWCKKSCYGWSVNFRNTNSYRIFAANSGVFLADLPARVVDEIADAIKIICAANGLDNMRWHGIGDLAETGCELDLIDSLTSDGDFVVWGFTRKGDVLNRLPVRDNIVFWCSVDPTMMNRLDVQVDAAERHGTMLAYSTHVGDAYGSRVYRGKSMPPWEKPKLQRRPKHFYEPGPDRVLEKIEGMGLNMSVVFGYHGRGRLTYVGVPNECPATDPLGGGHFLGTCLECGWCIQKPDVRKKRTLKENRKKWVDADSFTGEGLGYVWLDDGRRR